MTSDAGYRQNHYVPVWYQERFIPKDARERKFKYLNLRPDVIRDSRGRQFSKTALKRWGPQLCFCEEDLYTTKFGADISTEIEKKFFGKIDETGKRAVEFWAAYEPLSVNSDALHDLVRYLILQKLRTPKGLEIIRRRTQANDHNQVLFALQRLQAMYGAIWMEAQWALIDANRSDTKFIISDHPVTLYNAGCFPGSKWCRNGEDPEPRFSGTHVLFPISPERLLVLTNTAWVRNPYGNPVEPRPNPGSARSAVFNFTAIQTGRQLSEEEVIAVNYVIKSRALRFIASPQEEWLYPERHLKSTHWPKLGGGLLFMPDPRELSLGGQVIFGGFPDGRPSEIWDEYGHRPWEPEFDDARRQEEERRTFYAFQGEFARLFGPAHRGATQRFKRGPAVDDEEYHAILLAQEEPALSRRRVGASR